MCKNNQNYDWFYNIKNILYKFSIICPYLTKIVVFLFVVYVAIFTASDVVGIALNTLTFVSTLLVDAWIMKRKIKTMGYSLFLRKSHVVYCWITFLIFVVSTLSVLMDYPLYDRVCDVIKNYSFALLSFIALGSVSLEMAFAICEDD